MMVVSIEDICAIGVDAWNGFVGRHPLASVYHREEWHRVIEKTYGYRGSYCVLYRDNRIKAALPFVKVNRLPLKKRLIAYPYSDACDPLVDTSDELDAVIGKIEEYRNAAGIAPAEIRTYRLNGNIPGFVLDGRPKYYNFVLDLSSGDKERIFRSFHKDCVQRGIRKGRTYPVDVVEGTTFEDMRRFYDLHVRTRKRHGVPPQPLRFFRNLWEVLYPSKTLSLLLARVDGTPAAGVVLLKFKDTVYYKFAAAERRYLVKRPNHLLIWRIVEDALREGYSYLDFGRTFVGDEGLMRWKARWGTVPRRFEYLHPVDYPESRFTHEGNKTNRLLSRILKRTPGFWLRLSGELFYRYLA
ncbi:MAG: FemAB family protein [Syntrophorhabdaceae bacterium PtaU1.Bin034]|nr:MAG: FemAB family protein [Syntrophorhabdaceae bacterium PtaU1.Bin034]